jgi:hypothetical protein
VGQGRVTHPMWILAVTRRLAYAFVGLLAGDAVLLLYLLQNAIRIRTELIALHMGEPGKQISQTIDLFSLYARLSFVGWMFVGLPFALLVPAHFISRLPWPLRLLAGAALGPLALFLIFMLISDSSRTALVHGHMLPGLFTNTASLWPFSILVSTVAFVVYIALLRKEEVVAA